jgi:general secretion pathway protein A
MDFLNNIQCKNEPFASTTGEDRYISQAIRETLEKLTHSIRLGAGLHVVVGPGNSGKTTLLDQLSEKFTADSNTLVVTINNPEYSNLQDFFVDIAKVFRPLKKVTGVDNKKIQEAFNSFLYKQCQKEKKRVLLLIDNGQNLPDFCLQGLEDFYNHHTNCRRMLQTVICGEPSLQNTIKSIDGVSSRVVFTINLKPFSFKETKDLIQFHLGRAAINHESPPKLFTLLSQWAIYRLTQGDPKQITDLCHLIVLTLSIDNRKKAGWFQTLRCAKLLNPKRAKKLQLIRVGSLSSLIALMLVFGLWSEQLTTLMAPEPVRIPVAKKVAKPKFQPVETTKTEKPVEPAPEVAVEATVPPAPAEEVAVVSPQEDQIAAIIEKALEKEPGTSITIPAEKIVAAAPPVDQIAAVEEETAKPEPKTEFETVAQPAPPAEEVAVITPPEDKIAVITEEKEPVAEKPVTPSEPAMKITQIVSPAIKERRQVMPGDTFLVMIQKVYGEGHLKPHFINQVIAANPQLRDPDNLAVGDDVFFPVLKAKEEFPAVVQLVKPVAVADKPISRVSKRLDRELTPVDKPYLIGKLTVQPGETLGKLIRATYGPFSFNPDYTSKVLAANTHLKNPDRLEVGETVYFPDLPVTPEIGLPARPEAVNSRSEIPEFLGEIAAVEDETFGDMIRRIYGPYSFNDENVEKVLSVNPGLKNSNLLSVGQKIRFPTILVAITPEANKVWWARIITLDNLQSAYRFLRVYSKWSPPMLIIPSRGDAGQIVFNVLLQEYFDDKQTALKAINKLPASISSEARALQGLDSSIYYYWMKQ